MNNLKKYIEDNLIDEWKNTPFEGYCFLNTRKKGVFGELFAENILNENNKCVFKRLNSDHDFVVDGFKTEVKFSLAAKKQENSFIMNHISLLKDWERLLYIGINPNIESSIYTWFDKELINSLVTNNRLFSHQQGGKKIGNDDYMITGKALIELVNTYGKSLSEW